MKPGARLLTYIMTALVGAGPFVALWLSARKDYRLVRGDLDACEQVIRDATIAAAESDKGASELARKPLSAIADRASKVKSRIAFDGPEEIAVTEIRKDQPAPYDGGLVGRARLAEMTQALEDRDAWALDVARLGSEKNAAEKNAALWELRASRSAESARRWRRKTIPLALGSGVAVYGLARGKGWITAGGLALGIGGALVF